MTGQYISDETGLAFPFGPALDEVTRFQLPQQVIHRLIRQVCPLGQIAGTHSIWRRVEGVEVRLIEIGKALLDRGDDPVAEIGRRKVVGLAVYGDAVLVIREDEPPLLVRAGTAEELAP